MTDPIRAIRDAVSELMPEIRADLESLVRIPSCAFEGFPREPVAEAAERTRRLFDDAGLTTQLMPIPGGEPAVVGRGGSGDRRVLLYAHYDVQPPGDISAWHTEPFTPTEKDGRLYGRGAADDKSGIAMHVGALKALRRALGDVPVQVMTMIEGEEECGGPLPHFVVAHPDAVQADAIVIGDVGNREVGEPTFVTALRGVVTATVEVRTLPGPCHSGMYGGPAPDALLVLIRVLDSLRDANGDTTIVPGYEWTGAPADETEFRSEIGMTPDQPLLGTGPLADRLVSRPAVSVIGLDAPSVDGAINAVVPYARARVSLRIPPGTDPDVALKALCDHLENAAPWGIGIAVIPGEAAPGCALTTTGAAYDAARWAMREAFGKESQEAGEGGSIPLVAAFQQVEPRAEILLIGVEDPAARIHAPNESVSLAELESMVLAEALFLARYGGAIPD